MNKLIAALIFSAFAGSVMAADAPAAADAGATAAEKPAAAPKKAVHKKKATHKKAPKKMEKKADDAAPAAK
jgi:hypothetical protein